MQRADFHFDLPDELIARYPSEQRSDCRLLCLDGGSGAIEHRRFPDLLERLAPGDVVVFNDTRVIPARLHGHKASGGRVEMLLERPLDAHRGLAHIRASKSPKPGTELVFEGDVRAVVEGRRDALFELRFLGDTPLIELLERHGHMPLPPYIDRDDELADRERYQTVYARRDGAVAAPTAGLHFDEALMDALRERGIETAFVTLHVGAGTFQPVRVDDIREHHMHSEWLEVDETVSDQVRAAKARGSRVIAVGTTSVRCLESAARPATMARSRRFAARPTSSSTQAISWRCVDASGDQLPPARIDAADAGVVVRRLPAGLDAYRAAVAERYRFFSYGDAMFLTRKS